MNLPPGPKELITALWDFTETLTAVAKFAHHRPGCSRSETSPCDCGLTEALAAARVQRDAVKAATEKVQAAHG